MWETIFIEYGVFFLKVLTIVFAILVVLAVSIKSKSKSDTGQVEIRDLSEKLLDQQNRLEKELLSSKKYKEFIKEQEKEQAQISEDEDKQRLFVIEFDGDAVASQVEGLRNEINAILTLAKPKDEVLVKLESPGGTVYGYGLGASQLRRIKDRQIPLTVSVDKVAASGGYMMACVADKILAAPFAVVGSIGVVAEVPNIHRLLKRHDVDVDVMTAGKYKRTVTILGENTEEGKEKFQQELEEVHTLFKDFVHENRPMVDIEQVATGEAWYGTRAKELNLIDEIGTSDDLLLSQMTEKDILLVKYEEKKSLIKRLGLQVETSLFNLMTKLLDGRRSVR